jgi:hypothetical protein
MIVRSSPHAGGRPIKAVAEPDKQFSAVRGGMTMLGKNQEFILKNRAL